jgi:hypothetical protein
MPAQGSGSADGPSPIEIDKPDNVIAPDDVPIRGEQERIEIESDDDDIEIILETAQLILTDRRSKEEEQETIRKIAHMSEKFPINFFTHEPTFAGWLNGLKREMTLEEAHAEVVNALTRPHLVLATIPGDKLDQRKLSFIKMSAGSVLGTAPPPVTIYPSTAWAYVECAEEKQARDLLSAKIVWNAAAKSYVVFRKPRIRPYTFKAVEVRGISSQSHWDAAKAALLEDGKQAGLEIKVTYPQTWVKGDTERIVWVVRHPKALSYLYPASLRAHTVGDKPNHPSKFEFTKGPVCFICAGEDHHLTLCPYKPFADKERQKAKARQNRGETAKDAKGKQREENSG